MQLLGDNRAQSIQVGAVLLFGILIVFLALYQATVVPDQNEEIEFDHNEELQEQMTELRSVLVSMPGTANTRSTSLDLGVRYPSRTIFLNPSPASGTLETVGTTDSDHSINISGANASTDEPVGVGDFWDGETDRRYNTGSIVYRPAYNEYTTAPRTILEHSAVLNDFDNRGSIPVTSEALYDDGTLTLVAVNGSLSENRVGRAAVDVSPKSTDTQTVELEPEDGENITVELPIEAGESGWEEVVEDLDATEGIDASVENELVTLNISESVNNNDEFDLELAKVGVGTGATGTEAAYIRDATNEDGKATVTEGENKSLTVEVRDDYNNPKRGVTVNASASEGSVEESKETRRNGEATFEYDSSGVEPGEDDVDFSITGGYEPDETHDSDAPENITITVTVEEEDTGPSDGVSPVYGVSWNQEAIGEQEGVDCNNGECTYEGKEAVSNVIQADMFTDPGVAGASVDYSLGAQQPGRLTPAEGVTDVDGENSTAFLPQEDNEFDLFVTSGNDGDDISMEVNDLAPRSDDLLLHLDAYRLRTAGIGDGEEVEEWIDRTENEFDAEQEDGEIQPIFNDNSVTGEFQGPTVQFGNEEYLETEWEPGSDVDSVDEGITISTVVRVNEDGPENVALFGSSNDETDIFTEPIVEPRLYAGVDDTLFSTGFGDETSVGDGGSITRGPFEILTIQYTGDTVREFIGQSADPINEYEAEFSGESESFFIGAISGHVGGFTEEPGFFEDRLDGDIAEILVYDEDLGEDREDVESYLEEKWFTVEEEDPEQDGIELEIDGERDSVTIDEGETVDYQIFETFDDGTEEEVTDEFEGSVISDSPDDVSVDEDANTVTGEQVAEDVTVTAENEFEATVDVTVRDDEAEQDGLVFEIDEEGDSVTIDEGETVDYTATATFDDGSTEDVTDEVAVDSDDTDVVTVDEDANTVTGESPGEDVTVTADDGEFTDAVGVTVDEITPPSFDTLEAETNAVGPGESTTQISEVGFEWEGSESAEEVTVEVENTDDDVTDSRTFTNEEDIISGEETLDNFGETNRNDIVLRATISNDAGSEECIIEEGDVDSGEEYVKDDFECTTS